jgi:hypothetical protein
MKNQQDDNSMSNESIDQNKLPKHQSIKKNESSKPVIAGSLLLIIGIIGILFSTFVIGGGFALDAFEDIPFQGFTVTHIEGVIQDSYGYPIENVSISIVDSHLQTKTDENGSYQILGIPSGYHQLIIEKNGYNTLVYNTYIISNTDSNEFMKMEDKNNDNPLIIDNEQFDFQLSFGSETFEYGSETPPHTQIFAQFGGLISGVGVITLICSILAILGGYFAIIRKKYVLVVLCSIAAIFSFGFFIGSLLAIIALIIIIISSNEFDNKIKATE